MRDWKGFKNVTICNGLFFFESFRVIKFICKHRCRYETTFFKKEKSIAKYILLLQKDFPHETLSDLRVRI